MTKMYSLEAIRLISKSLIPAVLDGRETSRQERDMLLAALYAGIAICSAPTALVHSMSRPLGARSSYSARTGKRNAVKLGYGI